jgi:DEAD/DEAH box helicase domain-containing protein
VVSTNALELGIDIGALDVAVMAGYPGIDRRHVAARGRAGRRSGRRPLFTSPPARPSINFVVRHPEYFFDAVSRARAREPGQPAHPAQSREVRGVRSCRSAATNATAASTCRRFWRSSPKKGFVHFVDGQWQWTQDSYPADAVSLRSVTSDNFVVVDTTNGERVLAETDFTSGPSTLPRKRRSTSSKVQLFQVERFDYDNRKAFVRAVECDYYTDAITYTKVTILETFVEGTTPSATTLASPGTIASLGPAASPGYG